MPLKFTGRGTIMEDVLEKMVSADSWIEGEHSCDACYRFGEDSFIHTNIGYICLECIESFIKKAAAQEEIAAWHYSRYLKALSPRGQLFQRLVVLLRYEEVEYFTGKQRPSDMEQLRTLLVENLGFRTGNRLDHMVRQAAVDACLNTGIPMIPYLIGRRKETEPWQFYANLVLCAGSIEHEFPEVQDLLNQAMESPKPEVRLRALYGASHQRTDFAEEIIYRCLNDPDPDVQNMAQKILSKWEQGKPPLANPFQNEKKEEKIPMNAIELAIDEAFTVDILKSIYSQYLYQVYDARDFKVKGKFSVNKLKKTQLVRALAEVCSEKKRFMKLFSLLPPGVQTVFSSLVWEGGEQNIRQFKGKVDPPIMVPQRRQRFGTRIDSEEFNKVYHIFPARKSYSWAGVFGSSYEYSLYLPNGLRSLFKEYLPLPQEYHLQPLKTPEDTDFQYEDQDRIVEGIDLFCAYIAQGNIRYTKAGDRPLKTSVRNMANTCNIEEFYPDEKKGSLELLKTNLIIDFIAAGNQKGWGKGLKTLKKIFDDFFSPKAKKIFPLRSLLTHLRGLHRFEGGEIQRRHLFLEKAARDCLKTLLLDLPDREWVRTENLIRYAFYRDRIPDLLDKDDAQRHLSFNRKLSDKERKYAYYRSETVRLTPDHYREAVIDPFIRGSLFLLSAFGIVDIAYDRPGKKRSDGEKEASYEHSYEGLRYLRRTPLGDYLLGRIDKYEPRVERMRAELMLEENRLLIQLDGPDPLREMVLDKMAERISERLFRVTFPSFLKDCRSPEEIREKIRLFKDQIESNPPQIWKDFLSDVEKKINPLEPVPAMKVFKLKSHPELISLVAKDSVLKKYLLKAEDYHVVVQTRHLKEVRQRLEEFGFYADPFEKG